MTLLGEESTPPFFDYASFSESDAQIGRALRRMLGVGVITYGVFTICAMAVRVAATQEWVTESVRLAARSLPNEAMTAIGIVSMIAGGAMVLWGSSSAARSGGMLIRIAVAVCMAAYAWQMWDYSITYRALSSPPGVYFWIATLSASAAYCSLQSLLFFLAGRPFITRIYAAAGTQ